MSVTIWRINEAVELPPAGGDWILALREGEWLADDAEEKLAQTVRAAGERIDALALPAYNYVGTHLLHGPAFYPAHQIRLFRRFALERVREHLFRAPSADLPFAWLTTESTGNVHIHCRLGDDMKDFARRRCEVLMSHASSAPSIHEQIARAYEAVNAKDDDWSTAAALIESWARVMEGVMEWDKKSGTENLAGLFSLPVITVKSDRRDASALAAAQERLGRLGEELERLRSENLRLQSAAPLARLQRACRSLADLLRHKQ